MNQVLGIHHEVINVFWLESRCAKKHGNGYRLCLDVIENMKNEADIPSSFEVTKSRFGHHRDIALIKLGFTNETPASIWKKHANNPRRIHPPLNAFSNEIMKKTISSISKIIINSAEFKRMLKSHANSCDTSEALFKEGKKIRSSNDEKEALEDEEPSNKNEDSNIAAIVKLNSED